MPIKIVVSINIPAQRPSRLLSLLTDEISLLCQCMIEMKSIEENGSVIYYYYKCWYFLK